MEVWPALDIAEGRVVRLTEGDFGQQTVYSDDPLAFVDDRLGPNPPRLHLVDLTGARQGRFTLFELVEQLALRGVRVQTGGGFRTLDDVAQALDAGAERIILGTRLALDIGFRQMALQRFGAKVAAGIDVKSGQLKIYGWERNGPDAKQFWSELHQEGWTSAQVTDVGRDGRLSGVDIGFWRHWAALPGSIGAGGGISTSHDLWQLEALGVERAVVGKAWIEGRVPVEEVTRTAC